MKKSSAPSSSIKDVRRSELYCRVTGIQVNKEFIDQGQRATLKTRSLINIPHLVHYVLEATLIREEKVHLKLPHEDFRKRRAKKRTNWDSDCRRSRYVKAVFKFTVIRTQTNFKKVQKLAKDGT